MQRMEDLVPNLLQPTTGDGAKAWASFFLNGHLVRQVSDNIPQDTKKAILDAGVLWDGTGWNTSKASKRLWDVVGVGLVSSDVNVYKDAFVYSLALAWKIDMPQPTLADRCADAAFSLAGLWTGSFMEDDYGEEGDPHSDPHSEAEVRLSWDEPEVEAPAELAYIWKEVTAGRRKLDTRGFLEACPVFKGLPQKPPENNHRVDNKKAEDKLLKAWQATVLHICKGHMFLYSKLMEDVLDKKEVLILHQKLFQLCSELCFKV